MDLAKKATITSVKQVAKKTIEVTIEVPENFNFIAGQYLWLMIPELKYPDVSGNMRMFSIASPPTRKGALDLIFRTGESGFKKTLAEMIPGAEVIFSGPFGSLTLQEDNSLPLVFVAGGVGVASFLSIIRFSNETHSGHKITLIYADASEQEALYLDELERIERENPNFKLFRVFGSLGEAQLKRLADGFFRQKAAWSVVGPRAFVDSVSHYLSKRGVPLQDISFEQFYPETAAAAVFKQEMESTLLQSAFKNPFFTAIESASNHIIITDDNGVILYANKGAENMTGYTFKEMAGNTPRLWGALMPANFYKKLWHTIKHERQVFHGKVKNRRKNQEEYHALIHISPIIDKDRNLTGFVATEEDLTKEQRIDQAKTEFISLASHQLRTPLTAISWYTEMILKGDAGTVAPEQKKYLEEIYRGNERMIDLVNTLLDVSRLELGTFKVEPKPTDVIALARSVLNEQKSKIEKKRLTIAEKLSKDVPAFSTDPKLLRMVFQNLLANSVEYSPEKSTVHFEVALDAAKKNLLITIADTGYGIPKNQQDKIFTKFFRADNVRDKDTDGTGLGLYIVKSIVESSGGKIRFESKENKGTTFYVTLPLSGTVPLTWSG